MNARWLGMVLACWIATDARAWGQAAAGQPKLPPIVESVVRPWMNRQQPPGVMVVVRRAGQTDFFAFGQADRARHVQVTPDSIFQLASITKVFTTTSLALEVIENRMQLADTVDVYLPALRQGRDIRHVTLEHLATHTSSLPRVPNGNPRGGWNRKLVLEWLVPWQAPHPPGSKSLYSNLAVGLLGHAIAAHEGQPLQQVWDRQFLHPLGMFHTFFEIPQQAAKHVVQGYGPQGHPVPHDPQGGWPAGGRLSSSGRDMAEFLVANLGERPDRPRISEAMQMAQHPYFKPSDRMTQGLCWQRVDLQGELVIDKNGGLAGTSTYIGMIPARHLGVVLLANRGKAQATTVGRRLLLTLAGVTPKDETPVEDEADAGQ